MPVLAEVRAWRVVFGGEAHSGWLPAGAAVPPRTPKRELLLDVRIEYEEEGYLLVWMSPDRSEWGDTWHLSLADAKAQAEYELGIPPTAWQRPE